MILFRLRVAAAVTSARRSWSKKRLAASSEPISLRPSRPPAARSRTKRGSAIDARLHTAVSSGLVNSMISVQRLDDLIVPRFCWFDFRFAESLKSMYGLPVSTWNFSLSVGR
jgi:hypothetical protein